jgi:hypothetical protein
MKKCCFLLLFVWFESATASALSTGIMTASMAASLKTLTNSDSFGLGDIFSPKGGIRLKKVTLSIEKNMNNNGAVRLHLVIVYDPELMAELKKMSSDEYFRRVDQLVKDYPDKVKIMEWQLPAKERTIPLKEIEYPYSHILPLAAYVFASYSTLGEHRGRMPNACKNAKIVLGKNSFSIKNKDEES